MALKLDSATLRAALAGYQQQLEQIESKMGELRRRLGKPPGTAAKAKKAPKKHRISPEGRERIAAAQRARWARANKAKKAAGA